VAEFQGHRLGISICEDVWNDAQFWSQMARPRRYEVDPIERLAEQGMDLLLNISAAPFTEGKRTFKREMFAGWPGMPCRWSM
jgi:predicted amidohydrolase